MLLKYSNKKRVNLIRFNVPSDKRYLPTFVKVGQSSIMIIVIIKYKDSIV